MEPLGPETPHWQGRIAVKVASLPPQTFSANFELYGGAKAGNMALTSTLGTTMARMQWNAEGADLQAGGSTRAFQTLDALTLATVGAELPVGAMIEWLQGKAAQADGWQEDLSQWDDGRISAHRYGTEPRVDLKLVLER